MPAGSRSSGTAGDQSSPNAPRVRLMTCAEKLRYLNSTKSPIKSASIAARTARLGLFSSDLAAKYTAIDAPTRNGRHSGPAQK